MNNKPLLDERGVIAKAMKILPQNLCTEMLSSLAELEDNEAHRKREFPKTRLHAVEGFKGIYRADIDKISGWRLHIQYGDDHAIHLCDVLSGAEHDSVAKVIKARRKRYDL